MSDIHDLLIDKRIAAAWVGRWGLKHLEIGTDYSLLGIAAAWAGRWGLKLIDHRWHRRQHRIAAAWAGRWGLKLAQIGEVVAFY